MYEKSLFCELRSSKFSHPFHELFCTNKKDIWRFPRVLQHGINNVCTHMVDGKVDLNIQRMDISAALLAAEDTYLKNGIEKLRYLHTNVDMNNRWIKNWKNHYFKHFAFSKNEQIQHKNNDFYWNCNLTVLFVLHRRTLAIMFEISMPWIANSSNDYKRHKIIVRSTSNFLMHIGQLGYVNLPFKINCIPFNTYCWKRNSKKIAWS